MIPLFKVRMSDVSEDLNKVLHSGYIGEGTKVIEFENALRSYFNNPFCNTTNSATSALHLALHMAKNNVRNEVLTTPLTCSATNFPIVANGLDIKWVDVNPNNCNMNMEDLRRKISKKTLAIMLVHWGGYPCDLDEVKSIQDDCEKLYGFKPIVIEDCAHAFGSKYKGKLIGTHGNFCVFSFQAIKHLTCGDGGLLISPNYESHKRAKLLRWYGFDREKGIDTRCEQNVSEWGYKFHMNDINATIGLKNLETINPFLQKHKENGRFYQENLKDVPGVTLLDNADEYESSYWIYTMRTDERDDFIKAMDNAGIMCRRVHDRNDKHDCLKQYQTFLPKTTDVCIDMVCIPSGWWVSEEDRNYIVDTIKKGW